VIGRIVAVGIVILGAMAMLAADVPEHPRDIGLTERATTRLAQIDVTVSGGREAIEGLAAADFEVRLGDKLIPDVVVDDLCVMPSPARPEPAAETQAPAPPSQKTQPQKMATATYLLYFEMAHLTQSGRQGSIASAREMLPKLLAGGGRAMIVASAAELKTVVPLTSDLAQLDAALAGMIDDQTTFDTYAATEEIRLSDVVHEMDRSVQLALALARRYAADERWRQERDLRRVSMVLGRLAELDPPKAVLYFSDTMRQNAGEHYLSFFAGSTLTDTNGKPGADAGAILLDASTGALPLDKVVNEAAGLGIRFYTVEGQGMTGSGSPIQARSSASNGGGGNGGNQASPVINSQRIRDSQGTMLSLAAETGGRAFLNGVSPARMASTILGDMSCLYLLSFDPKGFPQDKPLAVSVVVKRPKVKTAVRGRLVIQSESTRMTGRVLSAFATPTAESLANAGGLHVGLIPIAYDDGIFKARVQVALGGSAIPVTTWDVGASVVSKGVVWQDGSGRIQVGVPNVPVVFEKDMDFAPGDYDLVAVAHEVTTDTLVSKEVHGKWPKIDAELASLGPIAVSQPRAGGFLRNGLKQTEGPLVLAEDEPLRADVPTAVIALVCRAKDQKRPLKVVRTLIGETATPVGTTELDLSTDRCAQVVDLIPPKMLGAGRYRFVVTVSSDGNELTRGERSLTLPEPPPAPSPAPPVGGSS
jgi:VWFA-related protein